MSKPRRKRCVECGELFADADINMLYHFKSDKAAEQHEENKYQDDYDITDHLDFNQPYGYVCDYCRND